MPTTSSYYTDLEYPTVNQDSDTWGTLTNEYLDGLLTKLKNLSDRINAAGVGSDSDLSQILRDISQYDNINASIPTTVKSLFGITDLKAADTYSYATAWNATFDSYLQGFSLVPPGSSAAVQSFDYDLLAEKLRPYVDQAESNITQANADISHVDAILARLAAGKSNRLAYIPATTDSGISGTLRIWKTTLTSQITKQYFNFVPSGSWADSGVSSSDWDAATAQIYNNIDGALRTTDTDTTNMSLNFGQGQFSEDYVVENYNAATPGSIIGAQGSYTLKLLSGSPIIGNEMVGGVWFNFTSVAPAGRKQYQWYNASNYRGYVDNIPSISRLTSDVSSPTSTNGNHQDFAVTFRFRKYETRALY